MSYAKGFFEAREIIANGLFERINKLDAQLLEMQKHPKWDAKDTIYVELQHRMIETTLHYRFVKGLVLKRDRYRTKG